ncbi:MAG TPA: tetratricopeptide repeat protein, partial [Isosphaeraceae bacterium]
EAVPAASPEAGAAALALACAYLERDRETDAREALRRAIAARPAPASPWERSALADLQSLIDGGIARRRALLVGINAYVAPAVSNPAGAVADVDALAAVLIDRWDFRPQDITILTDAAATHDAVLAEVRTLAEASRRAPCLFAFSGVGSEDGEGKRTLVAVDSRQRPDRFDDIDLDELARIAGPSAGNLIAILDAGWTSCWTDDEDARSHGWCAPANHRPRAATRDLAAERPLAGLDLEIGRLTFYNESLGWSHRSVGVAVEDLRPDPSPDSAETKVYGRLCHALTSALWRLDPEIATTQGWIDAACESWIDPGTNPRTYAPVIVPATGPDTPLFGPPGTRTILAALTRVERGPVAALVPRLKRLIEKQKRAEDYLNLGLAHAALGQLDESIGALEEARNHEEATPGLRAEAQYHLGRALYERNSGTDLDRAVGELRDATERDPSLTGAFYYLGRALRDSARRNLRELAARAFQKYLDEGAPLGHRDEVRRWMAPSPEPMTATR